MAVAYEMAAIVSGGVEWSSGVRVANEDVGIRQNVLFAFALASNIALYHGAFAQRQNHISI